MNITPARETTGASPARQKRLPRNLLMHDRGCHWRQHCNLRTPVMILIECGTLAIRRDNQPQLAHTGDCVLLEAGVWDLEAFPTSRGLGVSMEMIPFRIDFVADCFREAPQIEAALIYAPLLPETGAYVQRGLAARIAEHRNTLTPSGVSPARYALGLVLNSMGSAILRYVRRNFFAHRWAMLLLMESMVRRSKGAELAAQIYAAGPRDFRRDCRIYLGLSAEKWLRCRRMELARSWFEHSECTVQEAMAAFGYEKELEFTRDFRREFGIRPERLMKGQPWTKLSKSELSQCVLPGWAKWMESSDAEVSGIDLGIDITDEGTEIPESARADFTNVSGRIKTSQVRSIQNQPLFCWFNRVGFVLARVSL